VSDENAHVLLEPSQPPGASTRIFSIGRRPRTRKAAKSGQPTPAAPRPDKLTYEERFEQDRRDKHHESEAIRQLVETARGVALILFSSRGDEINESLAWSLGVRLESVLEPVDAYYFGSLGVLNDSLGDECLEVLLERKLKATRAKISENRRKR